MMTRTTYQYEWTFILVKSFLTIAAFVLVAACGNGNTNEPKPAPVPAPTPVVTPVAAPEPTPEPAPTPTPVVTPPVVVTPVVVAPCTPAPEGTTGFGKVFKGCDAANVATYYGVDECVKDLATGLIWEGKPANATGFRGNSLRYTNFDDVTLPQNGVPPTQAEIDSANNSIGFKNSVNAAGLCGTSNWRMPTLAELVTTSKSLVADKTLQPLWFPNIDASGQGAYWSSTGFADPGNATNAPRNEAFLSTFVPTTFQFKSTRFNTYLTILVRDK
jgi:hypothetical protein